MLAEITPVVLTFNEEPNIERTLDGLRWARDVVLVDSGSTDRTLAIAAAFPNVRVLHRTFDDFAAQRQYALDHGGIGTPWVLSLDADFVVTEALVEELAALRPAARISGYRVRFRYCLDGRVLRSGLYPPLTALFRLGHARYAKDGHSQRLDLLQGELGTLRQWMLHDDRKDFARWLRSQERYASEEAKKLKSTPLSRLSWPDRVRKLPFAAVPLVGLQCLLLNGGVLDGRPGAKYAGQRMLAELLISLRLLDESSE